MRKYYLDSSPFILKHWDVENFGSIIKIQLTFNIRDVLLEHDLLHSCESVIRIFHLLFWNMENSGSQFSLLNYSIRSFTATVCQLMMLKCKIWNDLKITLLSVKESPVQLKSYWKRVFYIQEVRKLSILKIQILFSSSKFLEVFQMHSLPYEKIILMKDSQQWNIE